MTQGLLAVSILLSAVVLFVLSYNLPKLRGLLSAIGFYAILTGIFTSYSNWLPQTRGEVPPKPVPGNSIDVDKLTTEKLSEMGESVIFGKVGGYVERGIGQGQCPLCHTFKAGDIGDRAPNLIGIGKRAAERIKDPKYAGKATNAYEYIAESHSCPSCYVVAGFGEKGSNDTKSPMPTIHKAPISLGFEQLIAVDTWLYFREGETPPTTKEIRAAYEKFIPESERPAAGPAGNAGPVVAGPPIALATDTPEEIVKKMGCAACHQIPGISIAKTGMIGPLLAEKVTASKRIASPQYQARVKAGKASARTPKQYVIESIVTPSAYVVREFEMGNPEKSMMLPDFGTKFTYGALEKMADYLLSQDCQTAKKDGLTGPAMEPIAKVCG